MTMSVEKVREEITAYDGERIFLGKYGDLTKVSYGAEKDEN
jgi:hypothetical protein